MKIIATFIVVAFMVSGCPSTPTPAPVVAPVAPVTAAPATVAPVVVVDAGAPVAAPSATLAGDAVVVPPSVGVVVSGPATAAVEPSAAPASAK